MSRNTLTYLLGQATPYSNIYLDRCAKRHCSLDDDDAHYATERGYFLADRNSLLGYVLLRIIPAFEVSSVGRLLVAYRSLLQLSLNSALRENEKMISNAIENVVHCFLYFSKSVKF